MKIWVDDEREAPEGWFHAKTFHDAYNVITENHEKITHIAFDWMLNRDWMAYNGVNLIRELVSYQKHDGINIFHQPREHYTCHSSDDEMRSKMERMIDALYTTTMDIEVDHDKIIYDYKPKAEKKLTQLDRLRKNKGRR